MVIKGYQQGIVFLKYYQKILASQRVPLIGTSRWISTTCANRKRAKTPPDETIDALKLWNTENSRVYGPVLKLSTKKDESKTKDKNQSASQSAPAPTKVKRKRVKKKKEDKSSVFLSQRDERIPEDETVETDKSSPLSPILFYPLFSPSKTPVSPFMSAQLKDLNIVDHIEDKVERNIRSYFPSVTTILSKTKSPESLYFLERWKKQKIAELGEQGFLSYQRELFENGSNLHSCIQKYLEGVPEKMIGVTDNVTGFWDSLSPVLDKVSDPDSLEKLVMHTDLHYTGKFDCVGRYKDTLCLIDWKTSSKQKPFLSDTFDHPLQVAAYIGAYNSCEEFGSQIENGLVVISYGDGTPAHAHFMTKSQCVHYWGQWLSRVHQFWNGMADGTIQ